MGVDITGKSQKIKRTNDANDYYCGMSSNAIKEDFDDEYCNFFWLRDTINNKKYCPSDRLLCS